MGAAGQNHVKARLDWQAIIPQYRDLARELSLIRAAGQPGSPPLTGAISPLEVDPFDLYSDYPTATISAETVLQIGLIPTAELLAMYDRISGRDLYKRRIISPALALRMGQVVQQAGQITLADLARTVGENMATIESATLYLAKAGILRLPEIGPRHDRRL